MNLNQLNLIQDLEKKVEIFKGHYNLKKSFIGHKTTKMTLKNF